MTLDDEGKLKSYVKFHFVLFFSLYLNTKDQRENVKRWMSKGLAEDQIRGVSVCASVLVRKGSYHCSHVLCHNTPPTTTLTKIPTESTYLCITTGGWCDCSCAVYLFVRESDCEREREREREYE